MLEMMMTSLAVESTIDSMARVHELIVAYKKRGIDVVPIKELEEAISKAMHKSLSSDSLTTRIMESMMKGKTHGKK